MLTSPSSRKKGLALSLLASSVVLATCMFSTTAAAADGKLVIGIGTQFPPMEYINPETHKLTGFEVDFGDALAKAMGVDIQWDKTEFSQYLSGLGVGRFDAVLGAMSDVPQRHDSATFIDYLNSGAQLFTTKAFSKKYKIAKLTDFCGKSVAGSRNSSLADDVRAWSAKHCPKDTPIKVIGTNGSPVARLQLKQGRVQGVVQTTETVSYLQTQHPGKFVKIGKRITDQPYGMAFQPKDKELLAKAYKAFKTIIADGTYAKVLKKWNMTDQAVDTPTINLKPADQFLSK